MDLSQWDVWTAPFTGLWQDLAPLLPRLLAAAEAFARAYGADIMDVQSAGVSPATYIAPLTKQTLGELNLNIDGHFPKGMDLMRLQHFDVVINMSGVPVGLPGARLIEWTVPDPIGQTEAYYRTVARQIEDLVMRLIVELRTAP